jgi:aspartyl-tRNA synthetase
MSAMNEQSMTVALQPNDDLRAKYRYLDLRRPSMAEHLRKRSKAAHVIRSALHEAGK